VFVIRDYIGYLSRARLSVVMSNDASFKENGSFVRARVRIEDIV